MELLQMFTGCFTIMIVISVPDIINAGSTFDEVAYDTTYDIKDEAVASRWLDKVNEGLDHHLYAASLAKWNYETNLTAANERKVSEAAVELSVAFTTYYNEHEHFNWKEFKDPVLKRRFFMYSKKFNRRISIPNELKTRFRVIYNSMKRIYSTGKVCKAGTNNSTEECLRARPGLEQLFTTNRDWDTLLWAWKEWRDETGKPMGDLYGQFVDMMYNASVAAGLRDLGAIWRDDYELPNFEEEVARLWDDVKVLYAQLHTFVRKRLQNVYKDHPFPASGHIPAHVLGNLWGQMWNGVASLTLPFPDEPAIDITAALRKKGYNVTGLYQLADNFFQSLGLEPMPRVFWDKSMFTRPKDGRQVVCHPSAWDLHNRKDFRIKACTGVTHNDFKMVHHEMGHVQYFLQYRHQPYEFRLGANPEADLNYLMFQALQKVAFLPYGFLIDQWRWKVFRQEVPKQDFTASWWKLRCKYQGIYPPVARSSEDFDPGAKYHIATNTPYIRYFMSFILQFQFHKALCEKAGKTGPLHRCDIYNSKEAGKALGDMLSLGCSKPWPEVLKQLTGSEKMDARPLLDYFKPLYDWLVEQNKGEKVGFDEECPEGSIVSEGTAKSKAEPWLRMLPGRHIKEQDIN